MEEKDRFHKVWRFGRRIKTKKETAEKRPSPTVSMRNRSPLGVHAYPLAGFPHFLEFHFSVDEGEKRIIPPAPNIRPGMTPRALLADDDAPRAHPFAAEPLDSQALA